MSTITYYLITFLPQNHAAQVFFYSFFSDFLSKIGKNRLIFCNFFSLCINDLRKT